MLLSAFRSSRTRPAQNNAAGSARQQLSQASPSLIPISKLSLIATNVPSNQQHDEPDLRELNNALLALAELFPDVRPDVFREMLSSLSEESRLHVVVDQLLTFGAKWIQGRWRISARVSDSKILTEVLGLADQDIEASEELIPLSEQFRTQTYKQAVRVALVDEFRNLSRTTIEGVLAEKNFSYTRSRPVLAGLAAKSWRINFKALMKWKKTTETHFMLLPARTPSTGIVHLPQLKRTSSLELDEELYQTVLKPVLDKATTSENAISQELAVLLNNADAKENNAIYECECCFDEVAFELTATCSTGDHFLCFSCVQSTVSAALYAQAWSKSIDHDRSCLACFAPSSSPCPGYIPNYLTQRALLQTRGGSKTWAKFEDKLALTSRQASNTEYCECPFCTYAEVDEVYWPTGSLRFYFRVPDNLATILSGVLLLALCIPLCFNYLIISLLLPVKSINTLLKSSLDTLARKRRLSSRFKCLNPDCGNISCRHCKSPWRDPHKCNDKEEVSLRTSIEAAKSAASKRVCPKCNLSFVKESGCNKMTCTCGYTMCYLCRQGLGQSTSKDDPHRDHDYSHFCGHFRAFPGRCVQCDKCDLYREGNQEEIVRKAGENAEKEWRSKQKDGGVAVVLVGRRREQGFNARAQEFVDKVVETFVTC